MEQFSYLRPREKLQSRGVSSLRTAELLQVIIGSGTQSVSGAKIAKSVSNLLQSSAHLSYEALIGIAGLGQAKACQIIAAIELGRRIHTATATIKAAPPQFTTLQTAKIVSIEYITRSGAGEVTRIDTLPASTHKQATAAIKALFANALHDGAFELHIGIGYRSQDITVLSPLLLRSIKNIFDTATLLQIEVPEVWVVSATQQQSFRRKALL